MMTQHQYLKLYPISKDSRKLIVGTIHPHEIDRFEIPFFYGNVNSLWNILSDAFPESLSKPVHLEGILCFLKQHRISMSDTVLECKRNKPTALDQDFTVLKLNTDLIEQIKHSNIQEIFFTSGFGKNNAFKLFYVDILKQKISKSIRQNREVILDPSFFGREIKLSILYSPSGASNVGISRCKAYLEQKDFYQMKSKRPVYDFKVDYYREKFKS